MNDDQAFQKLDQEKLTNEVASKAKEEALSAVKEAQADLINRIQGKKSRYSWEERGDKAPRDYDELFNEVKKQSPSISEEEIDRRVEEKLKARDESIIKKQEEDRKKFEESRMQAQKDFDREWYDLVNQGKMPNVGEDLQKKINAGEKLTKEEIDNDEGLKARQELANMAMSKKKSAKIAYYEDYNQAQDQASRKAPVAGGRPKSVQESEQDLEYDDIVSNRKKMFGF